MRRSVLLLVALVALVATACDGNGGPPDFEVSDTPTASTPGPSASASSPTPTDSPSEAPSAIETVAPSEGPTSYGDYTTVSDDSGALEVDVPTAWSDVDGGATDVGPAVSAAPDVDAFIDGWETSGVIFIASREVGDDIDALLDQYAYEQCTQDAAEDYSDGEYTGKTRIGRDCGDTDTTIVVIAATKDDDPAITVLVIVQLTVAADNEALDRIETTFRVVGAVE